MYSCASINATPKLVLIMLIMISPCVGVDSALTRDRRVIPFIQNCDPNISDNSDPKKCLKGDWIDSKIADCERKSTFTTCTPQSPRDGIWVVEQSEPLEGCQAVANKPMNCTESGDSRCVCSSGNPNNYFFNNANRCKCQYWPSNAIATAGSVCYGYQQDGNQWACCYNIENMECYTRTWQISTQRPQNRCTDPAGVKESYIFNCGDCTCLEGCSSKCDVLITASNDRCGAWLTCFRSCCVKAFTGQDDRSQRSIRKRQFGVPNEFCGDGKCLSPESTSTCPKDCCPVANPNSCVQSGDTCVASCCQSPSCCRSTVQDDGGTNLAARNTYAPSILLALLFAANNIKI